MQITFTQSGPTDYTVTLTGGSGYYEIPVGGDTCTDHGFAEEQQTSQNQWDISYGVNVGSCTITFADASDVNDFTMLQVTNDHNPH